MPYTLEKCRTCPMTHNLPCVALKPNGPIFSFWEILGTGSMPHMLETCRRGSKSVSFCIEKTQNFDQVLPLRPWKPNCSKFSTGQFHPFWKPVHQGACHTCWKLAGEELGPFVWTLKRLTFDQVCHCSPEGQIRPNFRQAIFSKLDALWVRGLPYMMKKKACGLKILALCYPESPNGANFRQACFTQIRSLWWARFSTGLFYPN